MGRVLAIDFGHVRIGLSISDPSRLIASPLEVVAGSKDPEKAAKSVAKDVKRLILQNQLEIDLIIVGLPLNLNGSESTRSSECRKFAQALSELLECRVDLFDERMTSLQAERSMKEANLSRKKRAGFVDTVSSTILLQSYLELRAIKEES